MELLEIMKRWGVNDTPNNILHFEQEVREYYYQKFSDQRDIQIVGSIERGSVGFFHAIDLDKKVDLGSCDNCLNSDKESIMEVDGVAVCVECNNSWLIE